jgi:hypothetical protein
MPDFPLFADVRIIGETPYLLIQFTPDTDGVALELFSSGLEIEQTRAGYITALQQVLDVLEGPKWHSEQ